jgi:phenylacetate-CoA ligase
VNVFPTQIEEQLMKISPLAPHFQLELNRIGHKDEMRVKVETLPDTVELGDQAGRELAAKIKQVVGVSVKVDVAGPGEVVRSEGKAVRIVDNRPKE